MTWVILVFNALMLIWLIGGVGAAQDATNCANEPADLRAACEAGEDVGTALGAGVIIFLWMAGDVILGVLWLVTRPRGRDCPVCGNTVRRGETACRSCGYDFRAAAAAVPDAQNPPQPEG